eukprot:CAMPEP_0119155586 /NCGR_PEP_ID=MMETSP1310-20130426/51824_1 /TAXON_ID=464262 /ORGANISM="Genus nov. species nov., Strain RCC2339" /LENGTH=443 /DNA_ID=CAMNT_0007148185 /DNA_START=157 /DNA_END=1484 /DNA_ORIENTATION=-
MAACDSECRVGTGGGEPREEAAGPPPADDYAAANDWLERAAMKVERSLEEDAVLERAARIREEAGKQKLRKGPKNLAPRPAPKRKPAKTHWDYLLDEMVWLAKEFQKERRWKVSQSKKFANAAKRSKLDVVSRIEVRKQKELQALRKKASFMAHEVMTWWGKVEKLVMYKRKAIADEQHKKDLDDQLDFLVGQTEKYVSTLTQSLQNSKQQGGHPSPKRPRTMEDKRGRLQAGISTEPSEMDLVFDDEPGDEEYAPSEGEEGADDMGTLAEEEALAAREGGQKEREAQELAGLQADMGVPVEELRAQYGSGTAALLGEEDSEGEGGGAGPSSAPQDMFEDEPGDEEYAPSEGEEGADDMGTLAEEEALAAREGGQKEREAQELAGLQADMGVPVEELRAQYGSGTAALLGEEDSEGEGGGAGPSSAPQDMFEDEPGDEEYAPS